jgi:glucosamine--fructose-6-phosphate aminotransferase (isomerizing)
MTLMRDEIVEQPAVLENLIKEGRLTVREIARRCTQFHPDFIFIAARGSSDNAATYARYIFESYSGLPVSQAAPSLFTLYRRPPNLHKAWVVGVSQSGQSEDIVEVMREGHKRGAFTVAITNNPKSPITEAANVVFDLNVGQENSIAATKTYTAQLTALAMLAAEVSDDNGLRVGLERVPDAVADALKLESAVQDLANYPLYREAAHSLVLGRGYNFATALELALKLKETAYVFTAPYSSADFLHGPFALAEKSLPAVLIGANGPAIPGLLELGKRLQEHEVEIITIGDDPGLLKMATANGRALPLDLKGIPEALSPIPAIVPGQLFSLHLALTRGQNPDRPRGLSKITSTR